MGYAHMQLNDYETAATYFMGAHRIDSQRVSLRLVMLELRRKIKMGLCRRKRSWGEVAAPSKDPNSSGEQHLQTVQGPIRKKIISSANRAR